MPCGILKLEGYKLDTFPELQRQGLELITRKGLRLRALRRDRIRSGDSLWYFPAAGFDDLLVLRPDGDYWKFVDMRHFSPQRYGFISRRLGIFSAWNKRCWLAKMDRLIRYDNHADLIKMRGVKREIVYIH
jgi:hypothetical protein